LITHLVAYVNFFFQEIGKGTPCTLPPILYGNNSTLGVIFNIEKKNVKLGSIFSRFFNSIFNLLKKLKAHNFRPRKIKDPKKIR
jgi:hypothetical protein